MATTTTNMQFTTSWTLTPDQKKRFEEAASKAGCTAGTNLTWSQRSELDNIAGSIINEDAAKTQASAGKTVAASNPIQLGGTVNSGNETVDSLANSMYYPVKSNNGNPLVNFWGVGKKSGAGVLDTYPFSSEALSVLNETGNRKDMQKTRLATPKPVTDESTVVKDKNAARLINMENQVTRAAAQGEVDIADCIKFEAMAIVNSTPETSDNSKIVAKEFSPEVMNQAIDFMSNEATKADGDVRAKKLQETNPEVYDCVTQYMNKAQTMIG